MKDPTNVGMNRTGTKTHPMESKQARQAPDIDPPTSEGDIRRLDRARMDRYAEPDLSVGTMPPPAGLKGAAKSAWGALKGNKETVLMDKLGERAAFERSGARLYEAALLKYGVHGSWPGGPTRERLEEIRREELAHFDLVKECIENLGGDPTAVTPSADLASVESMGLFQVATDARTDLRQTLHTLLVAELTDNAGWELLIPLARELGHTRMAARFEAAHRMEAHHLADVRGWLEQGVGQDAGVELTE